MNQDQACQVVVPFGKYRGKTLEQIALADKDVGYLDWMVGLKDLSPDLRVALECFLTIPWVSEKVKQVVEERRGGVGRTEPVENSKKPKSWWEK